MSSNAENLGVGHALENHLEALFHAHGVRYARGAETENRNKPDFLFPGQGEYRDKAFAPRRTDHAGRQIYLQGPLAAGTV